MRWKTDKTYQPMTQRIRSHLSESRPDIAQFPKIFQGGPESIPLKFLPDFNRFVTLEFCIFRHAWLFASFFRLGSVKASAILQWQTQRIGTLSLEIYRFRLPGGSSNILLFLYGTLKNEAGLQTTSAIGSICMLAVQAGGS